MSAAMNICRGARWLRAHPTTSRIHELCADAMRRTENNRRDELVTLRRPTEKASSKPRPKSTGEDEEITVPSVEIEEWPTECSPRTFNACRAAKSKMRRDGGRARGGSRNARRRSDKWKPLSHKTEKQDRATPTP